MNVGKTLFAQVMEFIPWTSFSRIVDRYRGNAGVRTLSAAEHFRVMAFAQLTWRESLRDIEASLGANPSKLYGMGFRGVVRRTTLADANERRDWKIWADLAAVLIRKARKIYASEELGLDLQNTVYALDSQINASLYTCLQTLSVSIFEKTELSCALQLPEPTTIITTDANQLILFNN
jgi:hypothetical protein